MYIIPVVEAVEVTELHVGLQKQSQEQVVEVLAVQENV